MFANKCCDVLLILNATPSIISLFRSFARATPSATGFDSTQHNITTAPYTFIKIDRLQSSPVDLYFEPSRMSKQPGLVDIYVVEMRVLPVCKIRYVTRIAIKMHNVLEKLDTIHGDAV
jgi:hypothetical protein